VRRVEFRTSVKGLRVTSQGIWFFEYLSKSRVKRKKMRPYKTQRIPYQLEFDLRECRKILRQQNKAKKKYFGHEKKT